MISCAVMKMRTAALNRSTSKSPSAVLNFIKFSEARLQAVLSRNRYSLHGFVEFCRPVLLQVCHLWIVVSNCIPGLPQTHVPSAILRSNARALFFSQSLPSGTLRVHHSRHSSDASLTASLHPPPTISF